MEAVPRLPMLSFELKISPVCPDFSLPFKRIINKYYGENGDLYDREILELENLRNNACRAARDVTGCSILKRYYCQIYSLFNRFEAFEPNIGVQCVWADIYSGQTTIGDLDFELACILYNIGALHSELGANDSRQTDEEMKISCTHFQCSVWAFQHLIEDKKLFRTSDLSNDILQFFVQIMLAQAQECILEKSMLDNRKSGIVAKVTAQVVEYYKSAMTMLQQGAMNTSSQSSIIEVVGSKLFKQWKKFIEFKLTYYDSICSLYMGNSTEDQQKMGERVAWYESADSKIKKAAQLAKQLDENSQEINDAINFVSDVITVKLSNAKKENDFIYHEKIPPIEQLPEVKGISLVKGIPFNVCDPEVAGQDIFARLVPIEAHEIASIYSARKDEILRDVRVKIEEKNRDLVSYLSLLQLEKDTLRAPKEDAIPDELINICAELSLHPESVEEVEKTLKKLDTISHDTGKIIAESKELLKNEEEKEREHQEKFGKRPPSLIVVELSKELSKHEETHKKAIESNRSLWENFEQHKDDILIMTSSSASKIASILPTNKNVKIDEPTVSEMERLFDKIEEMKKQRITLEDQLVKEMDQDNVLKLVLAHPRKEIEKIFDNEIKKYDKIVTFIEQNLNAQQNILNALTNCNAGYANTRKEIIEVQRARKTRIASLLYTYQVFKELQVNSKKGLEFYQKFQTIVTRLNARIRGVSKVQDEERQQFMQAQASRVMLESGVSNNTVNSTIIPPTMIGGGAGYPFGSATSQSIPPPLPTTMNSTNISPLNLANIPATGAKLKDYLPFMKNTNRSMLNTNPGRLPNPSPQPPPMVTPTGVGGQFTPSAPSFTPIPPQVSNINNVPSSYVPTNMLNQPMANGQQLPMGINHNPIASVAPSVTGSMMINSQYSPPPSYTQALSTQVAYSLPSIIGSTNSISSSSSSMNPSLTNQYYSNNNNNNSSNNFGGHQVAATAAYQNQKPIPSVLPIEPQNNIHPTFNQPSNVAFVGPQLPSLLQQHQQQFQRPSGPMFPSVSNNSMPNGNNQPTTILSTPTSYHQQPQQQNYYNSMKPGTNSVFNPNVGISPSPNQSQQQQQQQPINTPSNSNNNYMYSPNPQSSVSVPNPVVSGGGGYMVPSPIQQPAMSTMQQPSFHHNQSQYTVNGNVSVSSTGQSMIPQNPETKMQPFNYQQPYVGQQQQPGIIGNSVGYPMNIQQSMTKIPNGGEYQQTNSYYPSTTTTQQQQVNGHQINTNITNNNDNQQANITTILEQESKRGWSVLTPTPASSTVITTNTNTDTLTTKKSEPPPPPTTTTSLSTTATTTTTPESSLPDILSTMLSINNSNHGKPTDNSTDGKTINGHTELSSNSEQTPTSNELNESTINNDNNDNSNNDNTNNNNNNNTEPKDLLSQFDPLFA